jgi:hypothetical protein
MNKNTFQTHILLDLAEIGRGINKCTYLYSFDDTENVGRGTEFAYIICKLNDTENVGRGTEFAYVIYKFNDTENVEILKLNSYTILETQYFLTCRETALCKVVYYII